MELQKLTLQNSSLERLIEQKIKAIRQKEEELQE